MNQEKRRIELIKYLLAEQEQTKDTPIVVPQEETQQRRLLRALMNVRMPADIDEHFLEMQDAYLQEELRARGIVEYSELTPVRAGMYIWRGDITTLRCDAIVNAANSGMTGCYAPNHQCIDNCIHTYAGVQLRLACAELMQLQGHKEATGMAKITSAYNLPCDYILHTVGPIIYDAVTEQDCALLASCYTSCLKLAEENGVKSISFCCISTGEFRFPNDLAAQIAIDTVIAYKKQTGSTIDVIFNVFKQVDEGLYRDLLKG